MSLFENPTDATPLNPEEVEGLKIRHISTQAQLDRWENDNIQEAIAWLARRRKRNVLDEDFARQLHTKMFNKVWQWAGKTRRSDKNIGVAWPLIPVELRQLLDNTKTWIELDTYDADEIAVRFHHRLVFIHVFPSGNGRHARLMTDILLVEVLQKEPFSWGSSDLIRADTVRKRYIQALKAADNHDYKSLKEFVRS